MWIVGEIADLATRLAYGLAWCLILDIANQLRRQEFKLPLDIKNLEGESATTTIKVAGGSFEVEYHPHAATRQWQTNFGRLQRDQQDAVQEEDTDLEVEIQDEITDEIGKLVISWDLEYDGTEVPVNAQGLDMLSMPVQQALFQGILTDASGGDEKAKKRKKARSRRGSS